MESVIGPLDRDVAETSGWRSTATTNRPSIASPATRRIHVVRLRPTIYLAARSPSRARRIDPTRGDINRQGGTACANLRISAAESDPPLRGSLAQGPRSKAQSQKPEASRSL